MTSKEFETFFRENYVRALRHAAAVLHDEEGARDVVADAFERIYTLCSSGRCPDNHAAYLMTTVHHLSVDYLRQKNRQTAYAKLFSQRILTCLSARIRWNTSARWLR